MPYGPLLCIVERVVVLVLELPKKTPLRGDSDPDPDIVWLVNYKIEIGSPTNSKVLKWEHEFTMNFSHY